VADKSRSHKKLYPKLLKRNLVVVDKRGEDEPRAIGNRSASCNSTRDRQSAMTSPRSFYEAAELVLEKKQRPAPRKAVDEWKRLYNNCRRNLVYRFGCAGTHLLLRPVHGANKL
jgi:hypothetical protein